MQNIGKNIYHPQNLAPIIKKKYLYNLDQKICNFIYLPGVHLHPGGPQIILVAVRTVDAQIQGVEDSWHKGSEEEAKDYCQYELLQTGLRTN